MATADILLTPATIKYAPVGETLPDENSVEYGDDWGGNWKDLGYTTSPLAMGFDRETYEVFVEQLTNSVKELVVKENCTFETTLAEMTEDTLLLAFNGGTVTDTPASAGQVAKLELEAGGSVALDTYAFGFEGFYQNDDGDQFPVRVFVFKGNAVLNGQLQFAKNKEAGIPLQIKAKADTTKAAGKQLLKIQKVTAAAGSGSGS